MTTDTARKALAVAAAAAGIGTFLPWVTAWVANVSGIETDRGQVALGACVVGALLALTKAPWWWQLVASVTTGGMAIWLWVDVAAMPTGPLGLTAHPGAGLYLTTFASVAWFCLAGHTRDDLRADARMRAAVKAAAVPPPPDAA